VGVVFSWLPKELTIKRKHFSHEKGVSPGEKHHLHLRRVNYNTSA
jgi:hypothetical protein